MYTPRRYNSPVDNAPATTAAPAALSVSEVTRRVKSLLEGASELAGIWVRGEVSNVRLAGSGHLYFTLKDEATQLHAVYFAFKRGARRPPADGLAVLVHGDVRVYERGGEYQLVADDILPAGMGDLAQRFEALKQKLADEGLFDEGRKLKPPRVPRAVAVVTSITTAALRDVLTVLKRRAPYVRIVLFPASVQGDAAPPELIAALGMADACPGIELILLVRGGGSIEDLWCFNDEGLARAIAALKRPVITGIGHEIDFTIADFSADVRAATPSAAAELAALDAAELQGQLGHLRLRLIRTAAHPVTDRQERLARLFDRRLIRDVVGLVESERQALDALSAGLVDSAVERSGLELERAAPLGLLSRLAAPLARRIEEVAWALPRRRDELLHALKLRLSAAQAELKARAAELSGRDPRAPKRLGFALVWRDGALVRDPAQVAPGELLRVEVKEGEFLARRE
jgi:exodeoxyribonuclease VII large subunit